MLIYLSLEILLFEQSTVFNICKIGAHGKHMGWKVFKSKPFDSHTILGLLNISIERKLLHSKVAIRLHVLHILRILSNDE